MTGNPNDPTKAGTRQGMGQQPGKRPAATLELQATEIERRDLPTDAATATGETGGTASEAMPDPAQAQSPPPDDISAAQPAETSSGGNRRPETKATVAASRPRRPSGVGSFLSHLAAGIVGAAVAIFGADYAANTFGLSIPTYSAGQMDQLARRMGALEQDTKEHGAGAEANLIKEQIESLKAKVDLTAAAPDAIKAIQAQQQDLARRTGELTTLLKNQGPGADTSGRIGKLEDQFKMLAQSGASGQSGTVGQAAALVAKVDTIGTTLDEHLAEMRKSLQGDLQKQSAHFEDRLSEIDKGMSVETLKAGSKTLSDQIVGLKADAQKLQQDIATVGTGDRQLRQDLAALQQTTADLKTELHATTGSFAKTDQLSSVNATAAKLQADLAAITARDQSREQGANRILLTLQLANLKRAVERGGSYAKELAEVKRLAPKDLNLSALEADADKGLPTSAMLLAEFKDLTWPIVNADGKLTDDGSLIGQLWQGARSVVQVRKTGDVAGDSPDSIVARAEARLQSGDMEGTLREIGQLKGEARKTAEPWVNKVTARLVLDHGIADVEASLVKLMGPVGTN